jgi:GT2 family glycosyltransferase
LTLGSFDAQLDDPNRIEIVAVDDGSSDDSRAEIERFQKRSNIPLTTLQQNNLGPSSARNNGANNAQHDLLLFWDADMIADSRLVQRHFDSHASSGPTLVAGARRFWPQAMTTPFSMTMNKDNLDLDQYWRHEPTYQEVFSSNFSIRRKLFRELGGFDPSLLAYEDIDFSYRAVLAGVEIVYRRDAIGYHNHPMTLKEACRQQERYQLYAAALIKKHPDLDGQIDSLIDKGPIRWKEDRPGLIFRRLLHQLLASPGVLMFTEATAKTMEKRPINARFMRKLYWAVLGAYQLRGFRAGLDRNWA